MRELKAALASAADDTKAQLEQQSRDQRAEFDAEQRCLVEAHTKRSAELTEQHQAAQRDAETRLKFVKAAHVREVAKLTEQLEIARCVHVSCVYACSPHVYN